MMGSRRRGWRRRVALCGDVVAAGPVSFSSMPCLSDERMVSIGVCFMLDTHFMICFPLLSLDSSACRDPLYAHLQIQLIDSRMRQDRITLLSTDPRYRHQNSYYIESKKHTQETFRCW